MEASAQPDVGPLLVFIDGIDQIQGIGLTALNAADSGDSIARVRSGSWAANYRHHGLEWLPDLSEMGGSVRFILSCATSSMEFHPGLFALTQGETNTALI